MRIAHLRRRLHDLGAKPCHEDRLLRGWSQICSYDKKGSPAETFFPLALRNELPAIKAELLALARLRGRQPHASSHKIIQAEAFFDPGETAQPVVPANELTVIEEPGCVLLR